MPMRYRSSNLTEETKQEIREHYQDGLKIFTIANYLGLDNLSVRNVVRPETYEKRKTWAKGYYKKLKSRKNGKATR